MTQSQLRKIGGDDDGGKVQSLLRRYSSTADNIGLLNNEDELSDEFSEGDMTDQIGAATAKMLQPLRSQVGNMGVDVAVLDETLQTLIAHTEGANRQIEQVTNFVVDLIERLEDIDGKAKLLMDKWKEERSAFADFTEHADEVSERFNGCVKLQENKIQQLNELIVKLESETKRLSLVPNSGAGSKDNETLQEAKHLLVEEPENVDFHSKRKAFFALAEKGKTNDTYKTFKEKATPKDQEPDDQTNSTRSDLTDSLEEKEDVEEEEEKRTLEVVQAPNSRSWFGAAVFCVVSCVVVPMVGYGWVLYSETLQMGEENIGLGPV